MHTHIQPDDVTHRLYAPASVVPLCASSQPGNCLVTSFKGGYMRSLARSCFTIPSTIESPPPPPPPSPSPSPPPPPNLSNSSTILFKNASSKMLSAPSPPPPAAAPPSPPAGASSLPSSPIVLAMASCSSRSSSSSSDAHADAGGVPLALLLPLLGPAPAPETDDAAAPRLLLLLLLLLLPVVLVLLPLTAAAAAASPFKGPLAGAEAEAPAAFSSSSSSSSSRALFRMSSKSNAVSPMISPPRLPQPEREAVPDDAPCGRLICGALVGWGQRARVRGSVGRGKSKGGKAGDRGGVDQGRHVVGWIIMHCGRSEVTRVG